MPKAPAPPESISAASPADFPLPSSFEAGLEELEKIVRQLEVGQLPLMDAFSAYKRGAQLIQFCQGALTEVEQQVQILEGEMLQTFDPVRAKSKER